MIKKHKGTFIALLFGVWGLFAANGIKDFYFEMRMKARGEIISYASLQEFCGWTGDKKPGETDMEYAWRRARNMFSAIIVISFVSVLLFGSIFGIIFGIFWWSGAFSDDVDEHEQQQVKGKV